MTDYKKLNRADKIVRKCQGGVNTALIGQFGWKPVDFSLYPNSVYQAINDLPRGLQALVDSGNLPEDVTYQIAQTQQTSVNPLDQQTITNTAQTQTSPVGQVQEQATIDKLNFNPLLPFRSQGRQLYRQTRKSGALEDGVANKWKNLTPEQQAGFQSDANKIIADNISKNQVARTERRDQRQHDMFARQTYGKDAVYNAETGTYQVPDETGKNLVDAKVQPGEGDFENWQDQHAANQQIAGKVGMAAFGTANQIIDSTSSIDQTSSFGEGFQSAWDAASDVVGAINPMWGAIAKGAGTVMKAADNIFAERSDSFSVDDSIVANVGGSYGGTVSQMEDAASRIGKYGGLFSNGARRRANKAISKAKQNQELLSAIDKQSRDQQNSVAAMGDLMSNAYGFQTSGGYQQQYARVAKEGGFIPEIVTERIKPSRLGSGGTVPEIIDPASGGIVQNKEWTPVIVEWVPEIVVESMQKGGVMGDDESLDAPEIEETEQKSVIPEGSLHKNKHHMENADSMTKKGIPVVDDNDKQQAEIERNEIIFTKEVTVKLEELYKIYYDENSSEEEKTNAAIDAGKLLTKEIMLNTDDRTGLIETLQKGGALNYKGEPYTGRSLDELVEYAEKMNPRFIQRMHEFAMIAPFKDKETGKTNYGSHLLSAEYNDEEWKSDENPGPVYVFPSIMETEAGNGNLKYWESKDEALKEALKRGDYLKFDNLDEAEYFTNHYKEHYNVQSKDFDDMERYLQAHPKASPTTVRKMFMELRNETTE